MRIQNFRSETSQGKARFAATIVWEDCVRPIEEVYFETEEKFADGLSCNPHAFLIGCAIPAMHYGEKRMMIDAEICPRLRSGLVSALSWLRYWYYGPDKEIVRIEAKSLSRIQEIKTPGRAGFFFSGGIDSFAALRSNQLNFPVEHPGAIKDGLLVYGLELDDPKAYEYVVNSLSGVAEKAGITLIPVYTNIYLIYREEDSRNSFKFWTDEFMDAALAAVAHAFAGRLNTVSIAAGNDLTTMEPHGSHPMLGPSYSSYDMSIRLEGIELSRLDKTRLIGDWDLALQNLRVCNQSSRYRPGSINCGRCEKCIRTMLALMTLGALDRSKAFDQKNVSAQQIKKAIKSFDNPYVKHCYMELIEPLTKVGRQDLASAIRYKIATVSIMSNFKKFDHRFLNGGLRKLKKAIKFN